MPTREEALRKIPFPFRREADFITPFALACKGYVRSFRIFRSG